MVQRCAELSKCFCGWRWWHTFLLFGWRLRRQTRFQETHSGAEGLSSRFLEGFWCLRRQTWCVWCSVALSSQFCFCRYRWCQTRFSGGASGTKHQTRCSRSSLWCLRVLQFLRHSDVSEFQCLISWFLISDLWCMLCFRLPFWPKLPDYGDWDSACISFEVRGLRVSRTS